MSDVGFGTESPIVEVNHLFAVRYLTLAGFTVLLYDVTLTLEEEVKVVWSTRRWTLPKIAYLLNRYGACALAMFYLSFLMPFFDRSDDWCVYVVHIHRYKCTIFMGNCFRCKAAGAIDMVVDVTIETLGNGIVLYELIRLWAANRRIAILMAAGFILLHSATIVSLGIAVVQLRRYLRFIHLTSTLRTCYARANPTAFKGVYIPAVALDIYAFVLLLLNALSRPRSSSQKLLDLLWSDGAIFFLTTFSMRSMCLIINIAAPPSLSVLGLSFASAMVATAVSRLYLRLNIASQRNDFELSLYGSMYADEHLLEECEMQDRAVKLTG